MEAIARKVVEIVDARSTTFGFVDARELAEELGVSIDYVYAHATELGAMRLGSGPTAAIRFDLDPARQALEVRGATGRTRRGGGGREYVSWVSRILCRGLGGRVLERARMNSGGFDICIARGVTGVSQRATEEGEE